MPSLLPVLLISNPMMSIESARVFQGSELSMVVIWAAHLMSETKVIRAPAVPLVWIVTGPV
jgi:hypothetical protein